MLRKYRLRSVSLYTVTVLQTEAIFNVHYRTTLHRPVHTISATCTQNHITENMYEIYRRQ